MARILNLLYNPRTTRVLLLLHGLALICALYVFRNEVSWDESTYSGLADGLAHGRFSYWVGHFDPPPIETYRTQGYPAFLLLLRGISDSTLMVKLVQMLLQFLVILFLSRAIRRWSGGTFAPNLFLLIALPQLQLLYYTQLVFPETLMSFLLTVALLTATPSRESSLRPWATGAMLALGFWVRPVLLLFPLFVVLMDLLVARGAARWKVWRVNMGVLVLFAVLGPLPFAFWNLLAHGTFRPVPIAGSSVISNLGLWQLKLPGYGSMHYFSFNYFGREAIPFVTDDEAEAHYAEYQEQWKRIHAAAEPAMSEQDRVFIPRMEEGFPKLFVTRSPAYTRALDKAIAEENLNMILREPGNYLLTRAYTAVRLWVTNVNLPMEHIVFRPRSGDRPIVSKPTSALGWAKALYPFLITLLTFGVGLVYLGRSVVRDRRWWFERRWMLYVIAYIWLIHIPMSIQSRYTVPIHAITIACIVMAYAKGPSGAWSSRDQPLPEAH